MEKIPLVKVSDFQWRIEPMGNMRVPAILFADETLVSRMDQKVFQQIMNVASLPGIQQAAMTMPDAHSGYGFPVGGVAAFDANEAGIISAGGVGFDICCGVRSLITRLHKKDLEPYKTQLADELFRTIPAGVGRGGRLALKEKEIDRMLLGGAKWAVRQGFGEKSDLDHIEDQGCAEGADVDAVSTQAKQRQMNEMGTLGSGNHYLEVQLVDEIYDPKIAKVFGLEKDEVVVSIHCGSRGLGHQIGTDYLREMLKAAPKFGIHLPDRELACAPILSDLGQQYLAAMRAGINCALANRQIITHLVREAFNRVLHKVDLDLLYDVSHNTCKEEIHEIQGHAKKVFVHRKGATRAFGPGHTEIPEDYRAVGQPVLVGGSMGTCSYVLVGTKESAKQSFSSSCHGAGRSLSRTQAAKQWSGRQLIDELAARNIIIRCKSQRELAEEAPGAYKDVTEVVDVAEKAGISKRVARLVPFICVKG